MGATSETEICNIALTRIGHGLISSLDENTTAAQVCNLHYARTRDAMLRAHPWNFAIRRATLAQSATTPNHEFTYYHVLPVDCLKVIRTNWEADGSIGTAIYGFPGQMGYATQIAPYRIENVASVGKCIACNEDTVKIEYIAQITDVAQFDDLFVDCLAQRLAAEVCMRLTDNQSATRTMWELATAKLAEARSTDAQEGTPREVVDLSGWLVART
jgi:hypothetical protein